MTGAAETVDVVVIGAGVVGLAAGRALALAGREVIVLDAADAIGTGTSSRNSEVIHAGIYYPPGSLKARLCVGGKRMLYAYCAERGVAAIAVGKLIVATEEPSGRSSRRSPAPRRGTGSRTSRSSRPPRPRGWSRSCAAFRRCSARVPASWTATP